MGNFKTKDNLKIFIEKEIRVEYKDLYIAYNTSNNIWYAHSYDEEKYSDNILIPELLEDEIVLFESISLDKKEFDKIKKIVYNYL